MKESAIKWKKFYYKNSMSKNEKNKKQKQKEEN